MNAITFAVLGYVVLQLLLGAWVARKVRTEEDYLLAGRSLGPGLVVFTIFATWFGAETCLGAAGAVYANGLSGGNGDPLGYSLCILFLGLVFVLPLWRMKLTTAADLFDAPGADVDDDWNHQFPEKIGRRIKVRMALRIGDTAASGTGHAAPACGGRRMGLSLARQEVLEVDPESQRKLDELVVSHGHLAILELRQSRVGHADSRRQGA